MIIKKPKGNIKYSEHENGTYQTAFDSSDNNPTKNAIGFFISRQYFWNEI